MHLTDTLLSASSSSATPYVMSLMELLKYICTAGGTTPSAPGCIMPGMKFSLLGACGFGIYEDAGKVEETFEG